MSSSSPRESTKSSTLPTCASVCSRKPAYTSIIRAYSRRSSSPSESHGRDPRWPLAEAGAGRQEPAGLLAGEHLLPPPVPALVEPAPVAVPVVLGHVVGGVAGARRQVEQERAIGRVGPQVGEVADRPVGEVLREVVALLGRRGWVDLVVVVHQVGVVLVGLAAEEAVEALEPPPQGPAVAWCAHRHVAGRGEVPLAHGVRRVAAADEHLREESVGARHGGVVAGEARRELDDAAHPAAVVVASRQQAGARG